MHISVCIIYHIQEKGKGKRRKGEDSPLRKREGKVKRNTQVLEEKGKGEEALQAVQTLWEREKEVRGKTLH